MAKQRAKKGGGGDTPLTGYAAGGNAPSSKAATARVVAGLTAGKRRVAKARKARGG